MKKYTANYTYTNPNFVIQNLKTNQTNVDLLPILYVTKNILQRGFPTTLSKYLQSELGEIHKLDNFEERFLFATNQTPIWNDTIKGDRERNYFPAKDFFEKIIPNEFGEFSFIQSLLIPEIEINEITGEDDRNFINQQVDFYLPQAKLVIEIDGQQHKLDEVTRVSDSTRDNHLSSKGITTVRITTRELQSGSYKNKVEKIINRIKQFPKRFDFYKSTIKKIEDKNFTDEDVVQKLLPTSIIRFQILILDLIECNYINLTDEQWSFNLLLPNQLELEIFENTTYRDEFYGLVQVCGKNALELAIEDLFFWISNLWQLKNKEEFKNPGFQIKTTTDKTQFYPLTDCINIDFSLFKRYTDENKTNPDVIYIRTDYFDYNYERNILGLDKNYFRVSTTEPINYKVTDEDKPILEFFLYNIFDKPSFREGQFPIVSNVLNRKDTIGLLPTGGGKSLCYQLPCLLQPSINFVVCPIKSLMYDQNDNLVKTLVTNVSFITSDLEADERRDIERNFEQGKYLFVWISPEKFQIPSFREKISAIVANFSIAYAVVDEVHCLSEWGHDFRTSYLNLAKTIDKLSPKDENGEGKIKFIGLTATASVNVLKDIKIEFSRQKQRLEDENIKSLLDYSRKELQFEVINDKGNKSQKIRELIEELKDNENFTENEEKAGLIFTPNVNGAYGCYQVSNTLNTVYQNKVGWFSGDIPKRDVYDEKTGRKIGNEPVMNRDEFNKYKHKIQKDFKENKYQLLVATKAFGMGIDKQNIFYTFHYGLPSSVEALYQEAGRAGRWDKRKKENKKKIGKCYVLHSPETQDIEIIEKLFNKNTTFSEIKTISDNLKPWEKQDVFRQIFLFIQGQRDIEEIFVILKYLTTHYFEENKRKPIFFNKAENDLFELGIGNISKFRNLVKFSEKESDLIQKGIYKLSLLGIISDWTTDFQTCYQVEFNVINEDNIIKSLTNYITKYDATVDIKAELTVIDKNTILEKAIQYLLKWSFENIAYTRRQSLKTLSDWCSEFKDSESFKQRIDSYFIFSETTFVLQHIAENPKEYEKWFDVLTTNNQFPNKFEFEKLKDSISRFLESYRNSIGLNFVSGFVRLALNEYEDSDGKERFESALSSVKDFFTKEQQHDFLNRLKVLGKHLTEEQKMELSQSISRYYPEMLEELAEYYDLAYLLNDVYAEKLKELKILNRKLYEQLAEI